MPVSIVNSAAFGTLPNGDNAGYPALSFTPGAGTNFLVVAFSWNNNANQPTSVTFGGTAMTLLTGSMKDASQCGMAIYYLSNPGTGAANLVITGTNMYEVEGAFYSFTGANGMGVASYYTTADFMQSQTQTLSGLTANSMVIGTTYTWFNSDPTTSAIAVGGTGWTKDLSLSVNGSGGSLSAYGLTGHKAHGSSTSEDWVTTTSNYTRKAQQVFEVLASTTQTITVGSSSVAYAVGSAMVSLSLIAAPVTAAYSSGAFNLARSILVTPTTATYALGGVRLDENVIVSTLAAAYSLGAPRLDQNVGASPSTASYSLGSFQVQQNQTIVAGPVTATYATGGFTIVQSQLVVATPSTATFSLGAFQLSVIQSVLAGPSTLTVGLGSVSLSLSVTATPVTAAYSLGNVRLDRNVIAAPSAATYSLGAFNLSRNVTASPSTAAYSLGSFSTTQNPLIVVSPMTAAYSLGAFQIQQNQTIQIGTSAITASPGSVAVSLGVNVSSATLAASLGAFTLAQAILVSPVTATYTPGAFNVARSIVSGPSTATYALGAVAIGRNIVVAPTTANYTLGDVQPALNVNAAPSTAGFAPGAFTTGQANAQSVTVGPITATFTPTSGAVVTKPAPLSLSVFSLSAMFTAGSVAIRQNQSITAGPLSIVATLGAATPATPPATTIMVICPTLAITLGPVFIGNPQVVPVWPANLAMSLGLISLAQPAAPTVTAAPSTTAFQLGNAVVGQGGPQNLILLSSSSAFMLGTASVSASNLPLIVADPLTAVFNLPGTGPVAPDPLPQSLLIAPSVVTFRLPPISIKQTDGLTVPDGYSVATFPVVLDRPAKTACSIAWTTQDQTAIAGKDYVPSSGVVKFAVGESFGKFQVLVRKQPLGTPSRQFGVVLSTPSGLTIHNRTAVAVIPVGTNTGAVIGVPTPAGLNVGTFFMRATLGAVTTKVDPPPIVIPVAPLAATFRTGDANLTLPAPPSVLANSMTSTFNLGSVSLVVAPVVLVGSLPMTASTGPVIVSQNRSLMIAPSTMSMSTGSFSLTNVGPLIVVSTNMVVNVTLGAFNVIPVQVVRADPSTMSATLGAFTTDAHPDQSPQMGVGQMGYMTMGGP